MIHCVKLPFIFLLIILILHKIRNIYYSSQTLIVFFFVKQLNIEWHASTAGSRIKLMSPLYAHNILFFRHGTFGLKKATCGTYHYSWGDSVSVASLHKNVEVAPHSYIVILTPYTNITLISLVYWISCGNVYVPCIYQRVGTICYCTFTLYYLHIYKKKILLGAH